jgi:sialate O-acetylesterase
VAYSSVGYYFATDIQRVRPGPVGMIQSAVSGTAILPWESLAALEKSEPFRKLAGGVAERRAKLPMLMARYEQEILPAWEAQHPPGKIEAAAAAPSSPGAPPLAAGAGSTKADDEAAPPVPAVADARTKAASNPKPPVPPDHDLSGPTTLFNAMVNPHIPYAIKGVLWYQGEANAQSAERAKEYAELLPLLISGWRAHWQQGDFPFLFVQLPAFTVNRPWQELRNSQFKSLAVPNTGMTVALDLNPTNNLHPPNKEEVGRRLSLLARRLAYGETLVASGPLYRSMKVEGDKIRLTFTETGGGLALGGPPPAYRPPEVNPAAETELLGFQIGPANGVCVPAQAKIDGNTVLVWSDAVPQPATVTYAWDARPQANLYNKEGLPASPFRTDDAPVFTKIE